VADPRDILRGPVHSRVSVRGGRHLEVNSGPMVEPPLPAVFRLARACAEGALRGRRAMGSQTIAHIFACLLSCLFKKGFFLSGSEANQFHPRKQKVFSSFFVLSLPVLVPCWLRHISCTAHAGTNHYHHSSCPRLPGAPPFLYPFRLC